MNTTDDGAGKWNLRYAGDPPDEPGPCQVLQDNLHLLPAAGQALDLACGRGGNAIALASAGLQVSAWDWSETVIRELRGRVRQARLDIEALCRDVTRHPPEAEQFDVIVVSRFLDRPLMPRLQAGLRSGGLIFYQTFTRQRPGRGPRRDRYRLKAGELLQHFTECQLLFYREDDALVERGASDQAMLVARRQ